MPYRSPDLPPPFGVTALGGVPEIAVYAERAEAVDVCLFEPGDTLGVTEQRIPLREHSHGIWWGRVPELVPGAVYGLRADGPWVPEKGHRYNPAKLLLDPYAGAVTGRWQWTPEVFGHTVESHFLGDHTRMDPRDSRAVVGRGVVVDHAFDWGDDEPPRTPYTETLIYEAHVRGLTMHHPAVPAELRGTYAGMAHPAILEHLQRIGVTAVELLPVHASLTEPEVARRGLTNYWGYNTLSFFAPEPRYAAATTPQGVVDEVKSMVRALHSAGIEVILDVVYNHTAEQSSTAGATLSLRGLHNRAAYRLDSRGHDIDTTGCGNTLDLTHPTVTRMVVDSLRMWVEEYHVDGFRFDLAVSLARGKDDAYDVAHAFLVALRTSRVLAGVKLIAEPWDLGQHGWRTGQFPPPFSEWNDRYRDTVRTFWLADPAHRGGGHGVRELATRLAGSRDLFDRWDRGPIASVNYVTSHDGFTAADLTAYDRKHNELNGEDGRDGTDHNLSNNHGVEGPTADAEVLAARRRSIRNLLGTLMLSTGVPMITAGDELGRTQRGSNNAYCQDNETSWVDWQLAPWQEDLLETTAFLTRLRRDFAVLRQRRFFPHEPVRDDGIAALRWFDADGQRMSTAQWESPTAHTLTMLLEAEVDEPRRPSRTRAGQHMARSVGVVFHNGTTDIEVTLPDPGDVATYSLIWDSRDATPAGDAPDLPAGSVVTVGAMSIAVFALRH